MDSSCKYTKEVQIWLDTPEAVRWGRYIVRRPGGKSTTVPAFPAPTVDGFVELTTVVFDDCPTRCVRDSRSRDPSSLPHR